MPTTPTWWHLYHVTFRSVRWAEATYPVVTDHGELKAVAIAAAVHAAKAGWSVYEVSLVDAGPIEQDPSGLALVPPDAYDDRAEW